MGPDSLTHLKTMMAQVRQTEARQGYWLVRPAKGQQMPQLGVLLVVRVVLGVVVAGRWKEIGLP